MSHWTYIQGVIDVNAYGRTQPQARYLLDTVLEHLPYVTGSEGNMQVYVVQPNGHNSSCSHNEFGEPMWKRPIRDSHNFQNYEQQDHYLLILRGSLRDREFDYTIRELNKWLNRLAKRISVEDILVKVHDYSHKLVISDSRPYQDMYECYSEYKDAKDFKTKLEKMPWTEYLQWDRAPDSDLPLLLYAKYFQTPEVDEEIKRREEWLEAMESKINN